MEARMRENTKDNITVQEKLVLFMQAKEDLLVEHGPCKPGEYLNDEDIEELAMWDDRKANYVWYSIMAEAKEKELSCFRCPSCPWCTVSFVNRDTGCKKCTYGKRHGVCDNSRVSTWYRVCHNMHIYATVDFYKELVELLESL